MIGIEIITGRLEASFGPRLEDFLNEYPDAEILVMYTKGIEGGKGMVAILKYEIKEAPKPKNNGKAEALAKARAVKAAKDAEAKALKKAELEAKHKAELEAI